MVLPARISFARAMALSCFPMDPRTWTFRTRSGSSMTCMAPRDASASSNLWVPWKTAARALWTLSLGVRSARMVPASLRLPTEMRAEATWYLPSSSSGRCDMMTEMSAGKFLSSPMVRSMDAQVSIIMGSCWFLDARSMIWGPAISFFPSLMFFLISSRAFSLSMLRVTADVDIRQ